MEAKPEVGTFMLHQTRHREILILLDPWKQEQHNGQHPVEVEQQDRPTQSRLNTMSLGNHRGNLGSRL